jgi:hypothetical protein
VPQQWLIKHWGFDAVWEVAAKAITAKSLIWLLERKVKNKIQRFGYSAFCKGNLATVPNAS